HDVPSADDTEQHPHSRDPNREQTDVGRDSVELFDNLVSRGERKIVRFVVFHATLAAQNLFDLIQPLAQHSGSGLDVEVEVFADRREFAARFEGNENRVVLFVFAEEAALALLQHADDFKRTPKYSTLSPAMLTLFREDHSTPVAPVALPFTPCLSSTS